jgi:peptide/nickel transport system substrate-binding protein
MTIIAQPRLQLGDPHDCTDAADELTIFHAIFDTLVRRVGKEYQPLLAKSWSVSDDGKIWQFDLQADVKFHDGTAFDAEAVKLNVERMAREDKGYTLGSPAVWRQYLGDANISVDGPLSLTIELGMPMADLLDVFEQGFMVAPSSFAALDADKRDQYIGTGPYRLTAKSVTEICAERVDHFLFSPKNQKICWRLVPDADERLALIKNGAVQVANALGFEASKKLGAARHPFLSPVAIIYLLNAQSGPFTDPRVRRAVNIAVDRDALIKDVMNGAAEPLYGFVSPNHYGAATAAKIEQNRDEARRLLREAGYENGLTINVDCPTRLPDEAQKLTAELEKQLREIGISFNVTIHEEREEYAHMVRRKEIQDMCVFDSSPMSTFRVLYEKIDSRIAGAWWQGYQNKDIEALLDEGKQTPDPQLRAQIWQRAYALLQEDPAWLTLYNPIKTIGIAGDHPEFQMPLDGVINVTELPCLEA